MWLISHEEVYFQLHKVRKCAIFALNMLCELSTLGYCVCVKRGQEEGCSLNPQINFMLCLMCTSTHTA